MLALVICLEEAQSLAAEFLGWSLYCLSVSRKWVVVRIVGRGLQLFAVRPGPPET